MHKNKQRKNNKKIWIFSAISVCLLIVLMVGFFYVKTTLLLYLFSNQSTSNTFLAHIILENCQSQGKRSTSCYDTKLAELARKVTLEKAFEVTKKIQENDKKYSYCHVVAHKIASEEVKKDPTKWREIITRCPVNQCANGCIHGVFQERFKAENLSSSQIDLIKTEFNSICTATNSWNQTYYAESSCYHALGHLFVYMTKADLNKSTALCRETTASNPSMTRYCLEGSFMQVFQVLEPEDEALVKNIKPHSPEEAEQFCKKFSSDELSYAACVNQSWPFYVNKLKNNPQFVFELCSSVEKSYQSLCQDPIISVMPVQMQFNDSKLINYCLAMPVENQQKCLNIMANRMVSSDEILRNKSINFCSKVPSEYGDDCYISILSVLKNDQVLNETNKKEICSHFPADFLYSCLY